MQHLESKFMLANGPLFNSRFAISYFRESSCIEYFIKNRISSETISSSLVFSYNPTKKDLHVSRFYPELYLQSAPRYMSSVCFGFLINHCAEIYCLDGACHISLETVPTVCDNFYRKLKDFNFHVIKYGLGNVVELESDINRLFLDTSLIMKHIYGEDEVPFMK
ncbi:MAG: hypothetical protein C4522_03780 [Desulfobacteraceae bacterium]|nr:MAG: hypothetical protein C4522_03780 [Desulfobacteraceae bacterium]